MESTRYFVSTVKQFHIPAEAPRARQRRALQGFAHILTIHKGPIKSQQLVNIMYL